MFAQIVIFKLKTPELRETFLEITEKMVAWLHQQPGFISYDLVEGENAWSDRLVWNTRADEECGRAAFFETEIAVKILQCVDADFRSVTGAISKFEN